MKGFYRNIIAHTHTHAVAKCVCSDCAMKIGAVWKGINVPLNVERGCALKSRNE